MDALVVGALVSGVVGIVTGLLTLRSTRITEETKQKQNKAASEIDTVKFRLEHWTELVESLQSEIERKDREIELKDAKAAALQQTIDRLREARGDA